MYQRLDFDDFRAAFRNYGRADQFSYYALRALFDYLEDYEDSTGPLELDVIGLCCDWTEYESAEEACEECGVEDLEDLQLYTTVLVTPDGSVLVEAY